MIIRKNMLYGNSVGENEVPVLNSAPFVKVPGTSKGKKTYIPLSEELLQMHLLLLGGTGSGKTNTIKHIVPQIQNAMTPDDVMLLFDSKLDFISFHRESDIVVSSRESNNRTELYWNLFMEVVADGWNKESISSNSDEIAEVIFHDAIADSSQPFFPKAARDIFAAIIKGMTFLGISDKSYRIKHLNNRSLKKYLSIIDAQKLNDFLSAFPELIGVLKYVGSGKSEQSLGVFAELQSVVSHIFSGRFGEDGRFSIRKSVDEMNGTTVFIEYDPSKGKSLQPVYQLLVDLFLKEAISPSRKKGRVFVICDELKMLPHLNHFEDALNFGRSLGVSVIAGIQSMEQLYEVYGEFGGNNIASAFQTIFCFHTNNEASRKYIRGIYGENMSVLQYMTPSGKTVEERCTGNTVDDWDINSLHRGEAIIGLPYQKPFRFQISQNSY